MFLGKTKFLISLVLVVNVMISCHGQEEEVANDDEKDDKEVAAADEQEIQKEEEKKESEKEVEEEVESDDSKKSTEVEVLAETKADGDEAKAEVRVLVKKDVPIIPPPVKSSKSLADAALEVFLPGVRIPPFLSNFVVGAILKALFIPKLRTPLIAFLVAHSICVRMTP